MNFMCISLYSLFKDSIVNRQIKHKCCAPLHSGLYEHFWWQFFEFPKKKVFFGIFNFSKLILFKVLSGFLGFFRHWCFLVLHSEFLKAGTSRVEKQRGDHHWSKLRTLIPQNFWKTYFSTDFFCLSDIIRRERLALKKTSSLQT